MKVLHIIGDSKFGGGDTVILGIAKMAKNLGCQVDVLATDPFTQKIFSEFGIGIIPLDVIRREIKPLKDLSGLYHLYRFLKKHKYTIVHTHTSKAGFIGRLAARFARVKGIVHTVHGFAFHEQSHPVIIKFYTLLECIAAHCCNKVITVSKFHKEWALQLGIGNEQKVVAIPNGISKNKILSESDPLEIRRGLGIAPDELMFVSIGRLAPQKGLEYLINAVPVLKQKMTTSFKVVLAGDGELKSGLELMATDLGVRDNILFLGFRDDIGDLLAASDLVLLPSLREGLSIALLEAMAAGKPIITTTIGSNREVTLEGNAAILIPPKSEEALVEATLKLVEDKTLAEHLSVQSRKVYLSSYTEEKMLTSYRKVYLNLINDIGKRIYLLNQKRDSF